MDLKPQLRSNSYHRIILFIIKINLERMESKLRPGLYVVGELLDVDGVTGGYNFQNAWTTGYVAGSAIASSLISS